MCEIMLGLEYYSVLFKCLQILIMNKVNLKKGAKTNHGVMVTASGLKLALFLKRKTQNFPRFRFSLH